MKDKGRMLLDSREYIERFLMIRDKQANTVPFKLNAAQEKLHKALQEQDAAGKPMRAIVLKARQLGFSTYTEGRIFAYAATHFNSKSLILAHLDSSTSQLFDMIRLFYELLPAPLRPMRSKSNDAQMVFDNPSRNAAERRRCPGLNSSITCNTAGHGAGIGRGSTIQNLHCSEFAFWRGEKAKTLLGLVQAVPAEKGTMIVIESTANGFEHFQKLWGEAERGENDFVPIFCGWQENPEYSRPVPPGTVWTEKELELKEKLGLDDEQLSWRRWCIKNNCQGDERMFRQEYPSTPEEAFLTSGTGVFDNEVVMARIRAVAEPLARGRFDYDYDGMRITNIRWCDADDGEVLIYVRPEERTPYVLGGDTAGEGSDRFVGQVLDNTTGAQVAKLKRVEDEIWWVRQMYCLGVWYNGALMGIESNFTSYPQRELERLGYPYFYQRERYDTATHKTVDAYGFATTPKTRPAIISGLVDVMKSEPELVVDKETLQEMLTFIRNDAGRPEAAAGEHDDHVMALAIAHAIRPQQRYQRREKPEERKSTLMEQLNKRGARKLRR